MCFSYLKTLFLCFIEKLFSFFRSHFCGNASDVCYELLRIHLFRWVRSVGRGRGRRSGGCERGCPAFIWAKPADMPWFVTVKAQSLLHPFSSFLGGYSIDIHRVWISTLDVPSSSWLFFCFLRGFSSRSS